MSDTYLKNPSELNDTELVGWLKNFQAEHPSLDSMQDWSWARDVYQEAANRGFGLSVDGAVMNNNGDEVRNSDGWAKDYKNLIIDPDGWDRSDFERSWAEYITRDEFGRRAYNSTQGPRTLEIEVDNNPSVHVPLVTPDLLTAVPAHNSFDFEDLTRALVKRHPELKGRQFTIVSDHLGTRVEVSGLPYFPPIPVDAIARTIPDIYPGTTEPLYVVRLWDGFDGEWTDVSDPLPKADAEDLAGDRNFAHLRKRDANYGDIDYYKAWPVDTKMVFSDGNSQTRGPKNQLLTEVRGESHHDVKVRTPGVDKKGMNDLALIQEIRQAAHKHDAYDKYIAALTRMAEDAGLTNQQIADALNDTDHSYVIYEP